MIQKEIFNVNIIIDEIGEINQKVDQLLHPSFWDYFLKLLPALVALISVLIALRIFYLTRNKEFRIKRGEICGEISKCFFQYKMLVNALTYNILNIQVNKKYIEVLSDEEYISENYTHFGEESPNIEIYQIGLKDSKQRVEELRKELHETRRDLAKHFGQYKFYISKPEKNKFNLAVKKFNQFKYATFDYSNCFSEEDVYSKTKIYSKGIRVKLLELYKPGIDAIEKHLSLYN